MSASVIVEWTLMVVAFAHIPMCSYALRHRKELNAITGALMAIILVLIAITLRMPAP